MLSNMPNQTKWILKVIIGTQPEMEFVKPVHIQVFLMSRASTMCQEVQSPNLLLLQRDKSFLLQSKLTKGHSNITRVVFSMTQHVVINLTTVLPLLDITMKLGSWRTLGVLHGVTEGTSKWLSQEKICVVSLISHLIPRYDQVIDISIFFIETEFLNFFKISNF